MKKYGSTIWLLVILAFLPLEWYRSAIPYMDVNFVQKFYSMNGLQMFIHTLSYGAWRSAPMCSIWHTGCPNGYNFFEILTIYLLCLAIQYLVIKNQRGYLIATISKIWLQRANIYIYFQSINLDFFWQSFVFSFQ